MKTKQIFDDYCVQSGIRCFAFLKNSANSIEWSLWTILICVFGGLTVQGLYITTVKFISKPTITKVSVSEGGNFSFPRDPVLCININPPHQHGYPHTNEELSQMVDTFLQSLPSNNLEAYFSEILH